jgi:hypothetical protein
MDLKFIKILFISVVLFTNEIFSQTIEIPVITSVGISQTTKKPIVTWSLQHPELIDGYLIKRLIYQFPGVVDFSYNTVAQIDNPNLFSFEDNSGIYGQALPYERVETYRVVAFKNNNGQILLSPMSEPVNSIFVKSEFDLCKKKVNFIWNHESKNSEIFSVLKSLNGITFQNIYTLTDTVFSDFDIETDVTYFYKIIRNLNGNISESNICTIITKQTKAPYFLNSQCAVVDSGNINLVFRVDTAGEIEDFVLLKARNTAEYFDTLAVILFDNQEEIRFADFQVPSETPNFYVLVARNFCKSDLLRSDTLMNVVLKLENTDKTNFLEWSEIRNSKEYQIARKFEKSDFQYITNSSENSYSDDISEFYAEQFENGNLSHKFCYFISVKTDSNICQSKSNEQCILPEEQLFIPNAFNPNSKLEENRIFKPKLAFTADYTLSIYSRNGTLIFETNNPNSGWTAYDSHGNLFPVATYMYFVKYKNKTGKNIVKTGYVSLVY